MKKKFLILILPVALACNSGNNSTESNDTTSTDSASMIHADTTSNADTTAMDPGKDPAGFVEKAAVGGMMEIESGKVALKNSADPKVKGFAEMMVKDHTKASNELAAIAEGKKLEVPAALPVQEQTHLDELKQLKGADFDRQYMNMMVVDHKKTVDLFKSAQQNSDPELSAFAAKMLPVIELHTKNAQEIQGQLK